MRNTAIDRVKFISSIMIIFIHIQFPDEFGQIMNAIARVGVPIFFMVSGYFAYGNSREKLKTKAIKILYLFVFAYISFIVVKMALLSNGAEIISYLCDIINFESLLNIIVFNSVSGAYYAWFLIALLYCYLMCIIFNNNINKFTYALIPIVLAIHILFGEWSLLSGGSAVSRMYIRNFWLMGMPFFLIGHMLKAYEKNITKNVSNGLLIFSLVLGLASSVFERTKTQNLELFVGTIIASVAVFLLCIKNGKEKQPNKFDYFMSEVTLPIYIIHPLIVEIVKFLSFGKAFSTALLYWHPVAAVIITLLAATIYYILKINVKKRVKIGIS